MSDMRLLQGLGLANGMDEGQDRNLTRVLGAQYDPTSDFRAEIASKQIGNPKMLDYKTEKGFNKGYLMGGLFTHEAYKNKFSTPESTYIFLDGITKGDKPLLKPSTLQLNNASNVLSSFDTPEKMRQVQAALGVEIDGNVGNDTKRAAANYLAVFNEKEFKQQVKGALGATRNFEPILESFKSKESGSQVFAEGQLHIGSETKNKFNKSGVANTTQYGVVEKDYTNAFGKKVSGFPRMKGESDKDHALRFYKSDIMPRVEKIKGILDEPQEVVTAIAHLVWNRGNLPEKLDLTSEENSQKVLLGVTTTGRRHSAGVVNASIQGYNSVAAIKGWNPVSEVRTVPISKNSKSFRVEMYDAKGQLMFKGDKESAALPAPDSDIRPNRTYKVVGDEIKTSAYSVLSVNT